MQKKKISAKFLQPKCGKENVGNPQSINQQPASGPMYSIRYSGRFNRSWKLFRKRGYIVSQIEDVIKMLTNGEQLPQKYRKHPLHGLYNGCWECHVSDDLLLVWKQNEKERVIILISIGSHSELFDKKRR